jgi:hypothetical protein
MAVYQGSTVVKRRPKDGLPGKGISLVKEFYLATSLASGVTRETSGWTTNPSDAVLTPTNKYLWRYETTIYTDGTSSTTNPVIIGTYGEKGDEGLPGPIVVQKEWVEGDTHRYTNEVRDYIYVRGASAAESYWYTLSSKGEVTADVAPTGGKTPAGYVPVTWMESLAVKVLIGEEANLANLIFKDDKLISLRGTVNGVAADYSGQADFVPNIIIDGKTGEITAAGGKVKFKFDGSGFIADGNIQWNSNGNIEFLGGFKSPFVDVSNATITQFWEDEITSWANNFFENSIFLSLPIRIIPCNTLLNGQVFRIHALQKGITMRPEEYNGFYENGILLNEIQLNKGDAIEMVCICYGGVFHSWDIIRRYKCRPYNQ